MNRKTLSAAVLLALVLASLAGAAAKPNVVLIMTDDQTDQTP